ncbi:hypothetical protein [Priestia endophytica]|uniref:Uncharacterized protein n=1 Tax=Priestia endophytica TaxID=135735 RepID=A0AAX1Q4R7_9BACI|nr:hypothetical protein [Priestia endophytica]RAS74523.1 hypothetical protein A3864_18405 [Priestia endophytica]
MFFIMFLFGLVVGLALYLLTYVFVKKIENRRRVLTVTIIGLLSLLGSIFAAYRGDTMGYGITFLISSLGILVVGFLLTLFEKSVVWKKSVFTFVILFVVVSSFRMYMNQVDYWIIKETKVFSEEEESYLQLLQKDPTIQGYKAFKQVVVLSLGEEMAGDNIEVLEEILPELRSKRSTIAQTKRILLSLLA